MYTVNTKIYNIIEGVKDYLLKINTWYQ